MMRPESRPFRKIWKPLAFRVFEPCRRTTICCTAEGLAILKVRDEAALRSAMARVKAKLLPLPIRVIALPETVAGIPPAAHKDEACDCSSNPTEVKSMPEMLETLP